MKSIIPRSIIDLLSFATVAILIIGPALANETTLRPMDSSLVKSGEAIYVEHCASCHGAKLEGQPDWRNKLPNGRMPAPPHDESGHTWHHADKLLFSIVKLGTDKVVGDGYESDMPGFEDVLTDPQIIAVLSFIKSTWPQEIKELHDGVNERDRLFNN